MRGRCVRSLYGLVFALAVALANETSAQTPDDVNKLTEEVVGLYQVGKYAEAIPLARRALGLREAALGPDHSDVGILLNNLAALYRALGRNSEAEPLYKRSLAISEKVLGPDHPNVGTSLNDLALLSRARGRFGDAEALYKRALSIYEKALGPEHPWVGASLSNLGELYWAQGRFGEAEPLLRRTLALSETALGPGHPQIAILMSNLGQLLIDQGRLDEAEQLLTRVISSNENALGSTHPTYAASLSNLALLYRRQGRLTEAEPLYRRALSITEAALGSDHPDVGIRLNNLAQLYRALGRTAEAEPLHRRALDNARASLGDEHPDVGIRYFNLAGLALDQNNFTKAVDNLRRAAGIIQRRTGRGLSGASSESQRGEHQNYAPFFSTLVKAVHRLARADSDGGEQARETFDAAQWSLTSQAASSVALMAARSASTSLDLLGLVREREDLVGEWEAKDKQLIAAKSEPPAKRNASAEQALSDRLAAIDARLATIDTRFATDFPDYAALARPTPPTLAEVQDALREDEALVLFLDTVALQPLPEETFIWMATKTAVRWYRSDLGTDALKRDVAALRCGLDAMSWSGDGAKRCAELLNVPADAVPRGGDALLFDAARAHALYKSLLGEAADLMKGKHLLVVPSGALTTLPFQVLVTEQPKSKDLAEARWLIRDHAVTVLPSVSSLTSLRRTAKPSAASKPMIGFGSPWLDGNQSHPDDGPYYKQQAALARAQTGCATTTAERTDALRKVVRSLNATPQTGGQLADLDQLRAQAPLPETADELCEVARTVGGSAEDVRLGARATETEVKRLSGSGELAQYRILHFATHGTLAGQLSGTREPGLILTPPATATPEDDGYLSGSEIASLKLDADWVILSACNTAGGAGDGAAAEALSGLARVFIYAGARALLVSHWEVDSNAAVKLVTGAVGELAKDKDLGRAESLRRAMLAVMADTTRPAHWVPASHPSVWAPFVIVGEGGTRS